jgi:hypothetical protein
MCDHYLRKPLDTMARAFGIVLLLLTARRASRPRREFTQLMSLRSKPLKTLYPVIV